MDRHQLPARSKNQHYEIDKELASKISKAEDGGCTVEEVKDEEDGEEFFTDQNVNGE